MARAFWWSALGTAVLVSALLGAGAPLVASLEVRPGLRPPTAADLWLLGVFTSGVVGLLVGLSVLIGGRGGRRPAGEPTGDRPGGRRMGDRTRVGGWLLLTGGFLLAVYTVGWVFLERV